MGELIALAERRADRSRRCQGADVAFYYDLACPFSYLAAERVERLLGGVEWIPVAGEEMRTARPPAELRIGAERRAAELRLPIVWPDRFPAGVPSALRTAVRAAEIGAGARFGLAAARLAFCGGFDLDDPEVLAEASAAAGLTLDECLVAAGDRSLDATLDATARGLRAQGVRELPAVRAGRCFHQGERGLGETAAMLRARSVYVRPLAPVG
jgi:2-hydroxychromene-2-carboxylate isomerase